MSPAPRVLHVYKDVYPPIVGGIERHIDHLRTAMTGFTSDVLVASRDRHTRVRQTGGAREVAAGQLGRVMAAPLAPSFPLWVRRLEPDLVHVHMPNPTGELAVLLARRRDRPVVASYHADIVRQARYAGIYRPIVRAILRSADAVITGSEGIWNESPYLAGFEDRRVVVPYAVDTATLDPAKVPPAERDAVAARFGRPLVVATGRLVYYKRFDRLIRAAPPIEGTLVIVGGGPLEAQLRAMAAGVPNVHLTGAVDEGALRAILAAADCFVMASDSRAESFGIATVEAQSMGVPAVVVDTGSGTPETVDDGVTGVVVPNDGIASVVGAINRLLGDAGSREAMSRAARERAVARFSLPHLAESMEAVYRRVLAHR